MLLVEVRASAKRLADARKPKYKRVMLSYLRNHYGSAHSSRSGVPCPTIRSATRLYPQMRRGGGKRRRQGREISSANNTTRTHEAVSIAGYTELISRLKAKNNQDLILFRGHQDCAWPLLPKVGRPGTRLKGGKQSDLASVEERLFDNFKRFALPFLHVKPEDDLDWLAIAQHHGLPTRLLDWTSNALAALWFAVRSSPVMSDGGQQPGVVWVLNPANRDFLEGTSTVRPFGISQLKVYRPRHITPRLIAQAGYFTLHPLDLSISRFMPLRKDPTLGGDLVEIRIPPGVFCDLRDDLERLGVSDLSMFPDLDGICRFITWNNSLLEDEQDPPNSLLNRND